MVGHFYAAITILFGGATLALAALNSALILHTKMLTRVMKSPMSYFDTTPLGRLVNRFAKDVDMADNIVPLNIRGTLNILLSALSMVINISYSTPIFLAFMFPLAIFYFLLQVRIHSITLCLFKFAFEIALIFL